MSQVGDDAVLSTMVLDQNGVNIGTAATLYALTVPPNAMAKIRFTSNMATGVFGLLSGGSETDQAPNNGIANMIGASNLTAGQLWLRTNSSSQIRGRNSSATHTIYITTYGWIVPR
jgi:hypothetical protein